VQSSSSGSTRARCGCSAKTAGRCGRCSTSRTSTSPGTPASTRRCPASTSRTARSSLPGRGSWRRPEHVRGASSRRC
jgi:hypothetical protein